MKNDSDRINRIETAHATTGTLAMTAEIQSLRERVKVLEACAARRGANVHAGAHITARTIVVGIVIVAVAAATIAINLSPVVHSQNPAPDPLTIDRNGNVGIKTTTPAATLDVNGDFRAANGSISGDLSFKTLRFPDGTTQVSAGPPVGAVIAFNLPSCPAGWSEYRPAYGRFIRGIDRGTNTDPDGQRSIGSMQEDAIRNITGSIIGVAGASNRAWDWGFRPGTIGAFDVPYNLSKYNPYGGGEYEPGGGVGYSANFNAARVVPTAPENRPRNVALLYCEKSKS